MGLALRLSCHDMSLWKLSCFAGYQRELTYRHQDGSYSAFGQSDDSGSTWLTAFVLKSFAQAQQFITVDADDLETSQMWLTASQQENGCFPKIGRVIHKDMKGGLASGGESPATLTAYVLAALLEAGTLPQVGWDGLRYIVSLTHDWRLFRVKKTKTCSSLHNMSGVHIL